MRAGSSCRCPAWQFCSSTKRGYGESVSRSALLLACELFLFAAVGNNPLGQLIELCRLGSEEIEARLEGVFALLRVGCQGDEPNLVVQRSAHSTRHFMTAEDRQADIDDS